MIKVNVRVEYDEEGNEIGILLKFVDFKRILEELEDFEDYKFLKKQKEKKITRTYPLKKIMLETKGSHRRK